MPIERAVPATIFIAASMSFALRSSSLVCAISRTWSRVSDATLVVCGVGEPFATPAAGKPAHVQEQLVLQMRDAVRARRVLAESQEAAELIAEIRKCLEVLLFQCFLHGKGQDGLSPGKYIIV